MRKFLQILSVSFITISLMFAFQSCQKSEQKNNANPEVSKTQPATTAAASKQLYGSKSGVVEYESIVMGMAGKQVFYWDDGGKVEARYTSMSIEMFKTKTNVENVEINKEGFSYKYDAIKKTGTKSKILGSLGAVQGIPDAASLTKEMMAEYKYKDLGIKDILGKPCKGVSMNMMGQAMEVWSWNNLLIYMKSIDKNGKVFMEMKATKVDVSSSVPADKFNVPADVKLTELK